MGKTTPRARGGRGGAAGAAAGSAPPAAGQPAPGPGPATAPGQPEDLHSLLLALPQELLREGVWPHLGPASKAALRATNKELRALADAKLPSRVSFEVLRPYKDKHAKPAPTMVFVPVAPGPMAPGVWMQDWGEGLIFPPGMGPPQKLRRSTRAAGMAANEPPPLPDNISILLGGGSRRSSAGGASSSGTSSTGKRGAAAAGKASSSSSLSPRSEEQQEGKLASALSLLRRGGGSIKDVALTLSDCPTLQPEELTRVLKEVVQASHLSLTALTLNFVNTPITWTPEAVRALARLPKLQELTIAYIHDLGTPLAAKGKQAAWEAAYAALAPSLRTFTLFVMGKQCQELLQGPHAAGLRKLSSLTKLELEVFPANSAPGDGDAAVDVREVGPWLAACAAPGSGPPAASASAAVAAGDSAPAAAGAAAGGAGTSTAAAGVTSAAAAAAPAAVSTAPAAGATAAAAKGLQELSAVVWGADDVRGLPQALHAGVQAGVALKKLTLLAHPSTQLAQVLPLVGGTLEKLELWSQTDEFPLSEEDIEALCTGLPHLKELSLQDFDDTHDELKLVQAVAEAWLPLRGAVAPGDDGGMGGGAGQAAAPPPPPQPPIAQPVVEAAAAVAAAAAAAMAAAPPAGAAAGEDGVAGAGAAGAPAAPAAPVGAPAAAEVGVGVQVGPAGGGADIGVLQQAMAGMQQAALELAAVIEGMEQALNLHGAQLGGGNPHQALVPQLAAAQQQLQQLQGHVAHFLAAQGSQAVAQQVGQLQGQLQHLQETLAHMHANAQQQAAIVAAQQQVQQAAALQATQPRFRPPPNLARLRLLFTNLLPAQLPRLLPALPRTCHLSLFSTPSYLNFSREAGKFFLKDIEALARHPAGWSYEIESGDRGEVVCERMVSLEAARGIDPDVTKATLKAVGDALPLLRGLRISATLPPTLWSASVLGRGEALRLLALGGRAEVWGYRLQSLARLRAQGLLPCLRELLLLEEKPVYDALDAEMARKWGKHLVALLNMGRARARGSGAQQAPRQQLLLQGGAAAGGAGPEDGQRREEEEELGEAGPARKVQRGAPGQARGGGGGRGRGRGRGAGSSHAAAAAATDDEGEAEVEQEEQEEAVGTKRARSSSAGGRGKASRARGRGRGRARRQSADNEVEEGGEVEGQQQQQGAAQVAGVVQPLQLCRLMPLLEERRIAARAVLGMLRPDLVEPDCLVMGAWGLPPVEQQREKCTRVAQELARAAAA